MAITPILRRELVAAARGGHVQRGRAAIAGTLLAVVAGTFGVWWYWSSGDVTGGVMRLAARRSFLPALGFHAMLAMAVTVPSALSIAGEKDRRTLDFLLATPLGNAEIVLGKLTANLLVLLTAVASGLPVMILLAALGGIDPQLVWLMYAGMATTAFSLACLATWVSTGAGDGRRAMTGATVYAIAWWVVPMVVAMVLPRFGIHLPRWASTANAWILESSPFNLLMKLAGGLPRSARVDAVARMGGLQVLGGSVLSIVAIARLRAAARANAGGDGRGPARALGRVSWRIRPRPDVGDDPIFWRERYTARNRGLARVVDACCGLAVLGAIAVGTCYCAGPALAEVWNRGYGSGPVGPERPEMNLMIRLFVRGSVSDWPADQARIDFNVFLRSMSVAIAFFLWFLAPCFTAEGIIGERARGTWTGLLATPLTAGDILRGKMLAALWRLRGALGALALMWMLGLAAGAIHPLGVLISLLVVAAGTWFVLAYGTLAAVRSEAAAPGQAPGVGTVVMLSWTGVVPYLLPAHISSVLLGAASMPLDLWLSLASYRDVRAATWHAAYPHLQWIGLATGEGPLRVAATCLIGIVAPALGGLYAWRYANAHFDRLVGRPWRDPSAPAVSRS
jgi:ABC-type transport system involved in multi-copper enzyme maturation permease subunit